MNILISYATYTGSTQLVAKDIASVLEDHGHTITIKEAVQTVPVDIELADLVLLGSSSWDLQGQAGFPHNRMFELITQKLKDKRYTDKEFACFGCGDRDFMNFCGAVDQLEAFVKRVEGHFVNDSLRINKFWVDMPQSHKLAHDWAEGLAAKLNGNHQDSIG